MTAFSTVENAVTAMRLGAYDYLPSRLTSTPARAVQKALEHQAVVVENHELRSRLQKRSAPTPLIGESEGMRAISRLIEEVAQSDVTVLIEGESGTGRKSPRGSSIRTASATRTLHFRQLRRLCRATPRSRIVRPRQGRFHRRHRPKARRFQLADGGTLFLDEIGDLSPKVRATCCAAGRPSRSRRTGPARSSNHRIRILELSNVGPSLGFA